jgi:hypothetical protein
MIYKWADKVCLGKVTEYVSQGHIGELSVINRYSRHELRKSSGKNGQELGWCPKKLKRSS